MPEDNEKVEDFVSLWRKKMETEIKEKPSAIGGTIERIKEVEQENEQLRNKIKENIDLLSRTEEVVKQTIEENERLKEQINQAGMIGGRKVSDIQQENLELNVQVNNLTKSLTEKAEEITAKDYEIANLTLKLTEASEKIESMSSSTFDVDSDVTKTLIEDLQSELSKKKSQIDELEQKIMDLTEENEILNNMLVEKEIRQPVNYVIPVETPKPSVIKPKPAQTSSKTLEILCQDLQLDLNKYKRVIEKLIKEKSELQQAIESGGFKLEPDDIKELKSENEELKIEISKLQESLKQKSEEAPPTIPIENFEKTIKQLQEQLQEKEHLLTELKTTQPPKAVVPSGPMSGLIEDLQKNINKLKITIEEKNKIIEELKSS